MKNNDVSTMSAGRKLPEAELTAFDREGAAVEVMMYSLNSALNFGRYFGY
jgi:hypothetical protein